MHMSIYIFLFVYVVLCVHGTSQLEWVCRCGGWLEVLHQLVVDPTLVHGFTISGWLAGFLPSGLTSRVPYLRIFQPPRSEMVINHLGLGGGGLTGYTVKHQLEIGYEPWEVECVFMFVDFNQKSLLQCNMQIQYIIWYLCVNKYIYIFRFFIRFFPGADFLDHTEIELSEACEKVEEKSFVNLRMETVKGWKSKLRRLSLQFAITTCSRSKNDKQHLPELLSFFNWEGMSYVTKVSYKKFWKTSSALAFFESCFFKAQSIMNPGVV